MTIRPIVLALACTLPVGQALADARINYRSEGDGAEIQAMLIGHGKVRSDSDDTSVIFDAADGTMTVLDHGRRKYTRIGQAEIEQMSAALGTAMREMEQALANVPPEMRAQVQGMMGGALPGVGGEAMVKFENTGRRDSVAGYSCTVYETRVAGRLVSEQCMGGDVISGQLSAADRDTLERAMRGTARMFEDLKVGPLAQFAEITPFKEGMVPLRVTSTVGNRRVTSEFTGVETTSLDPGLFAIPAGYREEKLDLPKR